MTRKHHAATEAPRIDRDKLRVEIRKLASDHLLSILDDAIDVLPPAELHKIAKKYFELKRLRPDVEEATGPCLLKDVKRFEKASLAGKYYQSFLVNSKSYTEQSSGTKVWIDDYRGRQWGGDTERKARCHAIG